MQKTATAPTLLRSPVPLLRSADQHITETRRSAGTTLVPVRPGVYTPQDEWSALSPWDRYLARVHAAMLVFPDAAPALESAAALIGLPIFGEPRDIHFFDPDRRRSKRFGDVTLHTSTQNRILPEVDGLRMTTLEDTVVDLARVLPPAYGLAVADAARRQFSIDDAALFGSLSAQPSRRCIRKAQWVIERSDPRAESPGESVSRAVIEWCGLETPELQVEWEGEGFVDRIDFAWRVLRVLGESDGYGKYRLDDDPMQALRREKGREDRLRRRCNAFVRWDWRDVHLVEPLERRLRAAGVPQVRPRNTVMLQTLRRNPRSATPPTEKPRFV